jgi:hypothetical protein
LCLQTSAQTAASAAQQQSAQVANLQQALAVQGQEMLQTRARLQECMAGQSMNLQQLCCCNPDLMPLCALLCRPGHRFAAHS